MKHIRRTIVKEISKYKKVPQRIVKTVIDGFVEKIIESLFKGDDVEIRDFGTFKARKTKARRVNAFGKHPMTLPEKKKPVLKFSKNVWKKLNEARGQEDGDLDL